MHSEKKTKKINLLGKEKKKENKKKVKEKKEEKRKEEWQRTQAVDDGRRVVNLEGKEKRNEKKKKVKKKKEKKREKEKKSRNAPRPSMTEGESGLTWSILGSFLGPIWHSWSSLYVALNRRSDACREGATDNWEQKNNTIK